MALTNTDEGRKTSLEHFLDFMGRLDRDDLYEELAVTWLQTKLDVFYNTKTKRLTRESLFGETIFVSRFDLRKVDMTIPGLKDHISRRVKRNKARLIKNMSCGTPHLWEGDRLADFSGSAGRRIALMGYLMPFDLPRDYVPACIDAVEDHSTIGMTRLGVQLMRVRNHHGFVAEYGIEEQLNAFVATLRDKCRKGELPVEHCIRVMWVGGLLPEMICDLIDRVMEFCDERMPTIDYRLFAKIPQKAFDAVPRELAERLYRFALADDTNMDPQGAELMTLILTRLGYEDLYVTHRPELMSEYDQDLRPAKYHNPINLVPQNGLMVDEVRDVYDGDAFPKPYLNLVKAVKPGAFEGKHIVQVAFVERSSRTRVLHLPPID